MKLKKIINKAGEYLRSHLCRSGNCDGHMAFASASVPVFLRQEAVHSSPVDRVVQEVSKASENVATGDSHMMIVYAVTLIFTLIICWIIYASRNKL